MYQQVVSQGVHALSGQTRQLSLASQGSCSEWSRHGPVCPHEAGRPVLWQKVFAILPSPLIAQNPEATRVVTWFLGTPFLGDRQFAMMGIRPHTQIINQMQIALPLARAQCIGNVI